MHPAAPHLLSFLAAWFQSWGIITVFLGTMIIGESAIIPFFVLAAQGIADMSMVAIFSYLGVLVTDVFWFYIGLMSRRNKKLHDHYEHRLSPHLKQVLHKLFDKRVFLSMFAMKFMYGSRLLNLVWLGFRRFNLAEFFFFDAISAAGYIGVLALLGVVISMGIGIVSSAMQVVAVIGVAIVVLLVLYQIVYIVLIEA